MFRQATLLFIFLLSISTSFSQGKRAMQTSQSDYLLAEKYYHAADPTAFTDSMALFYFRKVISRQTVEKNFNEILADSYLKSGILEMSADAPEPALNDFRLAITIAGKSKGMDSLLFKSYLYAGSVQYNLNNLDSAVYYYKEAETVYNRNGEMDESERLFNKFGALYYETGDYSKSISYFEKALALVQAKKPVNIFFEVNYKNNIATALMKLGRYQHALEIFRDLLKYPDPGDALYYNIGNTYFEEKNYQQALFYVRKIRHLEFEKFNSLTKIFIRLKQYDSALYFLDRAKSIYLKDKGAASKVTYGIVLKYSGDLKRAAGKPLEALADYQSAIIHLYPAFSNIALSDNPVTFSGYLNFAFLFETLVAKASTLNAMDSAGNGTSWQRQSIRAYESALILARHMEKIYFSDEARLFLKTKVGPATQDAVDVAIQLYNKTKETRYINIAFAFAEDNKATVLQAGLLNLELEAIPGLPANLVADEKRYRSLLAKLEIQAAQLKDSITLVLAGRKIHDIEIALSSIQNKLDENPFYHDLKFSTSFVQIDSLQKKLHNKDEAILTYYYTSDQLICFYITMEGSGFSATPLHPELFTAISMLRNELTDPAAASSKSLHNAGSVLYAELIGPVYDKIKDKRRLIIIPFNEINYVPFEMIPLENRGMLLNKFAVSYNYAARFLNEYKTVNPVSYKVLAMAPFAVSGKADLVLPALPLSADEIEELPGIKFIGVAATKNQFVKRADQFSVIHLATHAVANDVNQLGSFIEFYGIKNDADTAHRLYEKEIYTLNLKSARLVILSACETGNGLLVNGEGVISLSRAFSYAGCKSVVTSLWKADEISTSFITKRFHHYLRQGAAIDEALQKAKIDYLDNRDISNLYKSPAYWANLVLIGDYRPVVESGVHWVIWLSVLAAVALLVLIVIKKTRHKNMPG